MGIKFANSAFATLAAGITNSATSITLTTGQGARFPSLGAGDYFYATLIDASNNLEIVKCTARSTDVLTVVRAQEGTTARAFSAADRIELRVTAAGLVDNLLSTDINAILPSQTSNSGKFLTTNGTATSWGVVPSAYGFQSMQQFLGSMATGGTFTWTRPSGIKKIKVYVVGGGGGAQNIASNVIGTGGAGGLSIAVIDVTSISSVTVTLGAGGAGSTSARAGSGGTSSFGSYASATGGEGGLSNNAPYDGGLGGIGTTTVTGAVLSAMNIRGNGGQRGSGPNTQINGAGSFFGGGGVGAHDISGTPAEGQHGEHGGGGGGSQYTAVVNGGAGVVLVEEYA